MRCFYNKVVLFFKILFYRIEKNSTFLESAALSFHTFLALVPLLAVLFAIAKGFGLAQSIEDILLREFAQQEEIVSYFITFSNRLLNEAQGSVIAGVGIIATFFTVIRLIAIIEGALNKSWKQPLQRPWFRQIGDYIAFIVLCPIVLTLSSSATIIVVTNIKNFFSESIVRDTMLTVFLQITPYVLSCLLFTILYIILPNTYVSLFTGIIGGIVAGPLFQILQAFYIAVQLELTQTSAIYGSFAAIPLFLLWLYFSWFIFLLGAEIGIIYQEKLLSRIPSQREPSFLEEKLIAIGLCTMAVDALEKKLAPCTIKKAASLLKVPESVLFPIIERLEEAQLMSYTSYENTMQFFFIQPKETISIYTIWNALEKENAISSLKFLEPIQNNIQETLKGISIDEALRLI